MMECNEVPRVWFRTRPPSTGGTIPTGMARIGPWGCRSNEDSLASPKRVRILEMSLPDASRSRALITEGKAKARLGRDGAF